MPSPSSTKAEPVAQLSATAARAVTMWHGIPTAAARRFHQICVAKNLEVLDAFGLTSLQYGAMLHLSCITGDPGIEQNVLASRLNIDRNTASIVVEQLVKLGVVAREVNGADRRARLLSLTPKGERFCGELRPQFIAANADILAPLAPRDRRQFMNLLIRVIEGNLSHDNGVRRRRQRS
jgi:DNA-binding MarR family transcriptional regulator